MKIISKPTIYRAWLQIKYPAAMLILLLQRSPVIRLVEATEEFITASPVGNVLRSSIAAAATLGTLNSLAGATTLQTTQASPLNATLGTPITQVGFTVTNTINIASWKITGVIPPGLSLSAVEGGNPLSGPGTLDATTPGIDDGYGGTIGGNSTTTPILAGTPTQAGQYTMTLQAYEFANLSGLASASFNFVINVAGGAAVAPAITTNPQSQTVTAGASVTFTAAASGTPAPTFQWKKGTSNITGATSSTLTLSNIQLADAGSYTVVATNSANSATSAAAVLTVAPASYLSNLSVRAAISAGQTLITGFVVDGGTKPILVRAAGPTLNHYGLTGVVDPSLTLFNGSTAESSNNDWSLSLSTAFATLGAFPFDAASKDAALQQSIAGAHTAQATATNSGTILVEAYDAGPNDGRQLTNLSARFPVGTGDNILIAGFAVAGTGTKQLLIRAVGPTLAVYGVTGALADPQLSVFDGSTSIASNNDWASSLSSTFAAVGAFALNAASKDAAITVTLQAGKSYTVQVSGVGNTTGEALVEIYTIP